MCITTAIKYRDFRLPERRPATKRSFVVVNQSPMGSHRLQQREALFPPLQGGVHTSRIPTIFNFRSNKTEEKKNERKAGSLQDRRGPAFRVSAANVIAFSELQYIRLSGLVTPG